MLEYVIKNVPEMITMMMIMMIVMMTMMIMMNCFVVS